MPDKLLDIKAWPLRAWCRGFIYFTVMSEMHENCHLCSVTRPQCCQHARVPSTVSTVYNTAMSYFTF